MEGSSALRAMAWGAHFSSVAAAMVLFGSSLFPLYAGARGWSARSNRFVPLILASILLAGLLLGTGLMLYDLTGDAGSLTSSGELEGFFLETAFGPIWLAAFGMAAILVAVALGFSIPSTLPENNYRQRDVLFLVLCAGILVSFAAAGHARSAAGGKASIAIGSEVMHLLAAAAWIGGLPPLLLHLARLANIEREDPSSLPMLHCFSFMGQWAVAILAMGGVSTLAVLLSAWAAIGGIRFNAYLLTLFLKLALLSGMLAIAAVNRFILIPGLEKGTARVAQLRHMILAECILGAFVIAAATLLSRLPPPI